MSPEVPVEPTTRYLSHISVAASYRLPVHNCACVVVKKEKLGEVR